MTSTVHKKLNPIKLFKWDFEFNKHLHFEIANMARCSAFGFTNASHEVLKQTGKVFVCDSCLDENSLKEREQSLQNVL